MAVQQPPMRRTALDNVAQIEAASSKLPYWARSTNPIVRRHLGLYWRTVPPELRPLITGFLVWAALVLIGILIPGVVELTLMVYLASIMVMPVMMIYYAHVLLTITINSAETMQEEQRNNTLQLLMATPMSLTQIFLGKVAAAIWRRMDDLVLIAQLNVVFALPLLYGHYVNIWSPADYPLVSQLLILLALLVSMLRIVLEPVMVGAIAIFVGTVTPNRSTAISASLVLSGFYLLLTNLLRGLPGIAGQPVPVFIVEFIVPVVLPVVIIFVMLRLARNAVSL